MSAWVGVLPIILAGLLYVVQSMGYYFMVHRIGMTLTFVGYAVANIGLIIDFYEMKD